jgi:hypothetical protein
MFPLKTNDFHRRPKRTRPPACHHGSRMALDLHCPKMGLGSFRKFRRAGIPCPAIVEIHNRYPVIIVLKGVTK